jgi:phosphatidylglycerol:prolipoprotein diacylglycerol transferase
LADPATFQSTLQQNSSYYLSSLHVDSLSEVQHKSIKAPGWLPRWIVAYHYPHNVINEGVPIAGCTESRYCSQLPIPVFPTPFYETIAGLLLFGLLWSIRKKMKVPATLFAVYLMVNGFERFFIEKIRVNTTYSIFGFHPTQAELISAGLIVGGVVLYWWLRRKAAVK